MIGGNIATAEAAEAPAEAAAARSRSAFRPDLHSSRRRVPQISAIANVTAAAHRRTAGSPTAAFVFRRPGQARSWRPVMMGSMFAGTEERRARMSCSRAVPTSPTAAGSLGAMSGPGLVRTVTSRTPPPAPRSWCRKGGIEGRVPSGCLVRHRPPTDGRPARRHGAYTGSADIQQMRTQPQFVRDHRRGRLSPTSTTSRSPSEAPTTGVG